MDGQPAVSGSFRPQDVAIYRPYPDEVPWELLLETTTDESHVGAGAEATNAPPDAELTRVAKHAGEVVGVYVLRSLSATRYELCSLVVVGGYRHRGLGRWLLGHAIGLAETRGGREILVRGTPLRGLFRRTGFVASGDDLLLTLTPE